LAFERDGVTVLVDEMSIQYMEGSEIDWVDDMIGASFQIKNPNATASCGCGTSFDV
jgi:iron-sulfur cluster assembly accessory protein